MVYSLPEAGVIVSVLGSNGIAVWRPEHHILSANPMWLVALGGIRILVDAGCADAARLLLSERDGGWRCPPRSYARQPLANLVVAILLAIFCAIVPPPRVRGSYGWTPGELRRAEIA